jgi:GntR family transcriptional regulator
MQGRIARDAGVARYHQLYTLLREGLSDGTYAAGSALPSEAELARRYHVSRNTVRRALARLEAEHRVVRVRGSGTYVRAAPEPGLTPDGVAMLLSSPADGVTARGLRFQRVATPHHVRQRWPEFDHRCLLVQRRRFAGEECFVVTTSHVPETVARALTRARLGQRSVIEALAELGVSAASGERSLAISSADAASARYLELPVGAPLVAVETVVRDAQRRLIEHQRSLFRPDRFRMTLPLAYSRDAGGMSCVCTPGTQPLALG